MQWHWGLRLFLKNIVTVSYMVRSIVTIFIFLLDKWVPNGPVIQGQLVKRPLLGGITIDTQNLGTQKNKFSKNDFFRC